MEGVVKRERQGEDQHDTELDRMQGGACDPAHGTTFLDGAQLPGLTQTREPEKLRRIDPRRELQYPEGGKDHGGDDQPPQKALQLLMALDAVAGQEGRPAEGGQRDDRSIGATALDAGEGAGEGEAVGQDHYPGEAQDRGAYRLYAWNRGGQRGHEPAHAPPARRHQADQYTRGTDCPERAEDEARGDQHQHHQVNRKQCDRVATSGGDQTPHRGRYQHPRTDQGIQSPASRKHHDERQPDDDQSLAPGSPPELPHETRRASASDPAPAQPATRPPQLLRRPPIARPISRRSTRSSPAGYCPTSAEPTPCELVSCHARLGDGVRR